VKLNPIKMNSSCTVADMKDVTTTWRHVSHICKFLALACQRMHCRAQYSPILAYTVHTVNSLYSKYTRETFNKIPEEHAHMNRYQCMHIAKQTTQNRVHDLLIFAYLFPLYGHRQMIAAVVYRMTDIKFNHSRRLASREARHQTKRCRTSGSYHYKRYNSTPLYIISALDLCQQYVVTSWKRRHCDVINLCSGRTIRGIQVPRDSRMHIDPATVRNK